MSKHFWGFPDTLPSYQQNITEQRKALEQQIALAQAQLDALSKPEQKMYDVVPERTETHSSPVAFVSALPLIGLEGQSKHGNSDEE